MLNTVAFQIREYERAFQAFVARSIDVLVDADAVLAACIGSKSWSRSQSRDLMARFKSRS